METTIDRGSPIPYYFQLKQILKKDLEAKKWLPGDRVPGDHELCRLYDVSRTVVRQTLREMEIEGLLERIKGKGTYVAQPKTSEGLVQSLSGLFEDALARGSSIHSKVLRLDVVDAGEQLASELGVALGAPLVCLERLRYVDGEAWVSTTTHIPHKLVPGLEKMDFSEVSLYETLRKKFGLAIHHAHRSIEAVPAPKDVALGLGVPPNAPVLLLRNTSYDADSRPIETFIAYHRGDRSRFVVNISASK